MKIIVKIGIETDGDFRLENHEEYKMRYDNSADYSTRLTSGRFLDTHSH